MNKITPYLLIAVLIISFLLGLNANLRLSKLEVPKPLTFTEDNIRKIAQEETIKIITLIIFLFTVFFYKVLFQEYLDI